MKHLIARAQEFGRKAAELRQAAQQLPAHAAQLRHAVTMTGAELRQIGTEVQSNLHSLRAEDEERLLRAMREISDGATALEEAGYAISGMDLDLGLNQRLAVHLDKFQEVPHQAIRALLSRQSTETVRSILSGVIKAEETAANVELRDLVYVGVIVHVGLVPAIRLTWRVPPADTTAALVPNVAEGDTRTGAQASPQPSSMFDLRPMPGGTVRIESRPVPTASPVPLAPASPNAAPPPGSSWSQDALARFKQMPTGSKYSR